MGSYQDIIALVQPDLADLDENLCKILSEKKNELTSKLEKYLFSKSKRIRSVLIFLLARAILDSVDENSKKIAAATELIHNATLIHDDIIDDSDLRRGETTINYEFTNDLAVVAGDFLLSLSLEELISVGNAEVIKIYAASLRSLCEGEINQYFSRNQVISIEEYIEKSERKTAMLFRAGLLSLDALWGTKYAEKISSFATNFGIAFQIRDDLINVLKTDESKPVYNDIKNGIYTAPVIYYLQDKNLSPQDVSESVIQELRMGDAVLKTKQLIQKHVNLAIASLDFLQDNLYKQRIINLCEYLSEVE